MAKAYGETRSREIGKCIHAPEADTTAIEAIPVEDRVDGMLCVDLTTLQIWAFDASLAGASASVLEPAAGSGRWLASTSLTDLASVSNGAGASLVGVEDAGTFTTAATVEAALAEIYQGLLTTQAQINIPLTSFVDPDGDPLAKFADTVPGFNLVNSEALNIRWANEATPPTILCQVSLPQDLDDTADIVMHFLCSKTGATVGDAVTLLVTAFIVSPGDLHDADANCGGTTDAMTGDATAKTVAELTLTILAADVPAAPCTMTFTVKPTNSTLGTDDLCLHACWIEYKRKILAA